MTKDSDKGPRTPHPTNGWTKKEKMTKDPPPKVFRRMVLITFIQRMSLGQCRITGMVTDDTKDGQ